MFQDEARVSRHRGLHRRIWAEKSTRPRAIRQQQNLNTVIFLVRFDRLQVNTVGIVHPCVNSAAMDTHPNAVDDEVPD